MSDLIKKLDLLAKILAVSATIAYGVGFLVVSSFLDRFEVGDAGADFLRIRYLQVGLLYASFPCAVIGPIFVFFYLRNHPSTITKAPSISILNIANLFLVFYWFATFADPGSFYANRLWIMCLFAWTIFIFFFARRLVMQETSGFGWVDIFITNFDPIIDCFFPTRAVRQHGIRFFLFGPLCVIDYFAIGRVAGLVWCFVVLGWGWLVIWRWSSSWQIRVKDTKAFVNLAKDPMNIVARQLWKNFPDDIRNSLLVYADEKEVKPCKVIRQAIETQINTLILQSPMAASCNSPRLVQTPMGENLSQVNCKYIQDAFPKVIAISLKVSRLIVFFIVTISFISIGGAILAFASKHWFDFEPTEHASFYYLYCLLGAGFIWRDKTSIPQRHREETRPVAWLFCALIVAGLAYMGVLGFAYGVYPQIPAARGGGNYVSAPTVQVYWRQDALGSVPTNIVVSLTASHSNCPMVSIPLKIIEETPSTLFVADPSEPTNSAGVRGWSVWKTPQVIALKRDTIVSVLHLVSPRKATNTILVPNNR